MCEKARIVSIDEISKLSNLEIPAYQRPYKWTLKNVNQLIDDIFHFKHKSAYRLGTLVLHNENNALNIVDGQQRIITLALISKAIKEGLREEVKKSFNDSGHQYSEFVSMSNWTFSNKFSKVNIHQNYKEILRRIYDFDKEDVLFLYNKCEMVKVELKDISEAFQFFDSQNARGKSLDPHDLLKAYHLRELSKDIDNSKKIEIVSHWETLDTDELKLLFATFLFRIRYWASSNSARYFTSDDIDTFKGINPEKEHKPFGRIYTISHYFTEQYNQELKRKIDHQTMEFPFQINQVIINGQRFFEYVDHYLKLKEEMYETLIKDEKANAVIEVLDTYEKRYRTGDQYIRNLFDCAMLFYWDKFGNIELGRITEKLFIWAYKKRLESTSVKLAGMDNYALEFPYIFKKINESIKPDEILNITITPVSKNDRKDLDEIKELFKKMNYYEGQ